jgi:AAA-like domain
MSIISSAITVKLFEAVCQCCLGKAIDKVIGEVPNFRSLIFQIKTNKQLSHSLTLALIKSFFQAQKIIAEKCLKELKANSSQTTYRVNIIYKPQQNHTDIWHLENKLEFIKQQLGQVEEMSNKIPTINLNEIEQLLVSKSTSTNQAPQILIDKLLPVALEKCPVITYENQLKEENSGLFEVMYECFLQEIVYFDERLYRIFTTLSQAKTGTDVRIIREELFSIRNLLEEVNNKEQSEQSSKVLPQTKDLTISQSCDVKTQLTSEHSIELEFPLFDSAFYSDCYKEVHKPGALIRVKAPYKWGKTYLVTQILNYANQQGYQVVRLDFKQAETDVFANAEKLLRWFCSNISSELNIPDKVDESWRKAIGDKRNCTNYLERYLLTEINSHLVLGLDDVDLLFPHQVIAHDFFSLLRSWHEDAKIKPIWKKLRLILAYSREDYVPLHRNQSPFNVGKEVELQELSQTQVYNLTQKYKLNWSQEQVKRLMTMLGGHPYLIRIALDTIVKGELTLDELLKIAPTEEGLYDDYLLHYLSHLEENYELLEAMKQVVSSHIPVKIDAKKASKLRDMGLVKAKGNSVEPLCSLYRLYFRDRLGV